LEESAEAANRLESDRAALAEMISAGTEDLTSARARSDELERVLGDLRQSVAAAHDRKGQIEVERARIESEAEHLTRTCFSELAMSLDDVVTSVELTRQLPVGRGAVADESSDLDQSGQYGDGTDSNESAQASDLTEDIDSIRARHDELRVKLDEMGPVNM